MIVGVAGPAINMVYAFVARDAGFFRSMVSMSASSSLMPVLSWPRPRSRAKLKSLCRRDQPPLPRALKGQTQLLSPLASIRSLIAWSLPKE